MLPDVDQERDGQHGMADLRMLRVATGRARVWVALDEPVVRDGGGPHPVGRRCCRDLARFFIAGDHRFETVWGYGRSIADRTPELR